MKEKRNFKRTTVTSALPYANGGVHIGHLAGVYVPADIYVRYLRLRGQEVIFIGGSDEHGVPVTLRAVRVDELRGRQVAPAFLTLVAVCPLAVAVWAFPGDVSVGEELARLHVVVLLCCLLHQLSLVV